MSPLTMYRDYRYSYQPSYSREPSVRAEVVTLPIALQMAVDGRVDTMEVFKQSPKELQAIIDGACRESLNKDFKDLTIEERKAVFSMFLLALQSVGKGEQSNPEPGRGVLGSREKRWWQFLR